MTECICEGASPINVHDLGDLVRVEAVFKEKLTGVLIDPTVVRLTVRKPDGSETTYAYVIDVFIVRDSQGTYHADIDADQPGRWNYRWFSTGSGQAAKEQAFMVA